MTYACVHCSLIIDSPFLFFSDLPKDGPYITGDKSIYQFGDSINLNCTSAKSYPASTLHWFINNIPVSKINYNIIRKIASLSAVRVNRSRCIFCNRKKNFSLTIRYAENKLTFSVLSSQNFECSNQVLPV